jgi:hypothetical protein
MILAPPLHETSISEKPSFGSDGGGQFFHSNNGVLLMGANCGRFDGTTDGTSSS